MSSESLAPHYETVGTALVKIENSGAVFGAISSDMCEDFRTRVATVSVEVLESYLADLVDLNFPESDLFIETSFIFKAFDYEMIVLSLLSFVTAVLLLKSHYSNLVIGMVGFLLLSPILLILKRSPLNKAVRRLKFAKIVSTEICRRRGINRDGPFSTSGHIIKEMVGSKLGLKIPSPVEPSVSRNIDRSKTT